MPDVSTAPPEPGERSPALGPGHRLDGHMRSRAESAYGRSLADVTVHTGPEADTFSRGYGGIAATVGNQVAFASGYYRPGTLQSDAIMAHELAHVVQQGGAAPEATGPLEHGPAHEEHGADRATANLLLAGRGGPAHHAALDAALGSADAIPARSAGRPRVQTCFCQATPAAMSDVTVDPEISEVDETVMDELEGLEKPYEAIVRRGADVRANATGAASMTPMGAGAGLAGVMDDNRAFKEATDAAAAEGTTVADVEAKAAAFVSVFQHHAVNTAYAMLESNEQLVQGEADRYAGSPAQGGIAELVTAAAPYQPKLQQAQADRTYAAGTTKSYGGGRGAVVTTKPPDAKEKEAAAKASDEEVRKALVTRFPVLADPDFHAWNMLEAPDILQGRIKRITDQRLDDIRQTRGELKADNSLVWQFDNAVAATKVGLEIVDGSVFDSIVKETIAKRKREEFFTDLLLGALAIGLGLLTFGGGAVAVLGAIGGAALSAGTGYAHVQKYLIESAAAGTAFDRAKAVSSQEPSLFWLAVDIVAAVFDIGMAVKAFTALKTTAKAVQTGTKSVAELKTEAVAFAKTEPKLAAEAEKFGTAVEQAAKKQLSRQDVISAAEKADSAGVAAVKAVAKDDASISGLLRVEGGARAKLLAAFGKKPAILVRLGTLIDEVPDVAKLVQLLGENLPANQFETVIAKYMLTRSKQAPYILRALSQVGLSADDVKALSTAIGNSKPVPEIGRKFATAAIDKIAERLPAGADGIKKFRSVAEGLHPNQSGIIFEKWASKNVYGGTAERFAAEKADLVKQYASDSPKFKGTKESLVSDNTLHNAGKATLVDYKSSQTAHKFGQEELDQLDNYAELIRIKAKAPNGDTFTKVEYLSGNKAAAEKNGATVLERLGDNAAVYYIDDAGAKVKFVGKGP